MQHSLEQTLALLASTPSALNALLRSLPEAWINHNEGDGTWTVSEVIAHLVDCERSNWLPRARLILDSTEPQTFKPLDRTTHLHDPKKKSLPQNLDDFAQLRAENLEQLRVLNFTTQDLEKQGIHPAFGPVTLSQLLATWATHDLTHLHQVSRIMAHQYREAVGPWEQYLGVLHCNGHSAP